MGISLSKLDLHVQVGLFHRIPSKTLALGIASGTSRCSRAFGVGFDQALAVVVLQSVLGGTATAGIDGRTHALHISGINVQQSDGIGLVVESRLGEHAKLVDGSADAQDVLLVREVVGVGANNEGAVLRAVRNLGGRSQLASNAGTSNLWPNVLGTFRLDVE